MSRRLTFLFVLAAIIAAVSVAPQAQITADRIVAAAKEPQNWITYNGDYTSRRYSTLSEVTPANVGRLELKWVLQNQVFGAWQSNPLVVDGVMYLTQRPNDVMAVDAKTGSMYWLYRHTPSPDAKVCCGANNRGLAMLGDTLFMGTLDAHLVAIDRVTGKALWNIAVADVKQAYSITMAPLVIKDKVLVGVGGGEYGIRGFVAAYDAKTGKEAWKFYTIPGPGEPGHDTWDADDWKTGGAPAWVTGSYDPALNLTYWGIGNPGPDWNPKQRPGDNLYADCVVALDADTGKLKWHFQFTPNDAYDYDAVQIPVLVDMPWKGVPSKLMLWANRNGFFYVLDRVTGKFLSGTPFVKVNWASGLDANGRPIQTPQPLGSVTYPGNQGGTNWYPPSFSPRTNLFYFSAWENYGTIYRPEESEYKPGQLFVGGGFAVAAPAPGAPTIGIGRKGPINNWTDEVGNGAVMAMDPATGQVKWKVRQHDVSDAGMLTTATDLLFTGGREGHFFALDARDGKELWRTSLGGQIVMAPITYQVDGKQYVTVIAGNALYTFALRAQ
ncbi:MAG: PQQ-dependent dehydrogenase, methanol/ethanol family [Vicinamibacterales bacterium]